LGLKDPTLAVISTLKANTAVSALVGTRVYRATLPPDYSVSTSGPAIAVVRVDKIQDEPTNSSKYATARIQCTTFATSDHAAENLSDLILAALEDKQNTLIEGVAISDIEDAGSVPDNSDGLTLGVYRDNHDFRIQYRNH
jgi:hypothetical protein